MNRFTARNPVTRRARPASHTPRSVTSNNTAGVDLDAFHQSISGEIAALTAKASPVAGDYFAIEDSAASNAKKSVTIGDIISDWATWAPSYSNITVGNGTVVARYTQIRKTIVAYWSLTLGSTSAISGEPIISTPITGSASYINLNNTIGTALAFDATGSRYLCQVHITSTGGNFVIRTTNVTSTYPTITALSATVPFTWTTSDVLFMTATYEAA